MCTTNVFTYVRPDGRKDQYQQPSLCTASRGGQPCASNVLFHHPEQRVSYSHGAEASQQLPPSPAYTPRSVTPVYRSGDESDRSYHSASSASRNKRASGVYINGQKVLDLHRSNDRHHASARRERIVLVDGPPTPRTPPQTYTGPHTAPSSPNFAANFAAAAAAAPYIVDAAPGQSHRRASVSHHASRRPVIVDERPRAAAAERPRVQIEVVDAGHRSKHSRHSSSSSREHSSTSATEDEERRRRRRHRQEREEQREREEAAIRGSKMRARIARANAEIATRPPVPMPPAPLRRSSTQQAQYARPAVEVAYSDDAELIEAVQRMNLRDREDKARRAARAAAEEEEAQRQRLMERMMPKRRATVGPGSRRHRVLYDDGVWRWE